MFQIHGEKQTLTVRTREPLVEGTVGAYKVLFDLSEDWDALETTAIFRRGRTARAALVEDGSCVIPWEVLAKPEKPGGQKKKEYDWDVGIGPANVDRLEVALIGTQGTETVLPTSWADLGRIQKGADLSGAENAADPTADLYVQYVAEVESVRTAAQEAATAAVASAETATANAEAAAEKAEAATAAADDAEEAEEKAKGYAADAAEALEALLGAQFAMDEDGHLYVTVETKEEDT